MLHCLLNLKVSSARNGAGLELERSFLPCYVESRFPQEYSYSLQDFLNSPVARINWFACGGWQLHYLQSRSRKPRWTDRMPGRHADLKSMGTRSACLRECDIKECDTRSSRDRLYISWFTIPYSLTSKNSTRDRTVVLKVIKPVVPTSTVHCRQCRRYPSWLISSIYTKHITDSPVHQSYCRSCHRMFGTWLWASNTCWRFKIGVTTKSVWGKKWHAPHIQRGLDSPS